MVEDRRIISRLSLNDYTQSTVDYLGYHFPMQLVIVCKGNYPQSILNDLNIKLAATSLGKLRKKAPFPGARDYWIPLPPNLIPSVHTYKETVSEDKLLSWLNTQVDDQYEVTDNAGWKISAINTDNDHCAISIILLHQLIDGAGGLDIIRQLATNNIDPLPSTKVTIYDDIADSKHYAIRLAPTFIAKKLAQITAYIQNFKKISPEIRIDTSETVIFNLDHAENIAREHGGSITSLGYALSANITNAILDIQKNHFLITVLKGDRSHSNSVKGASIDLRSLTSPITNLDGVKTLAKTAYVQRNVKLQPKIQAILSNVGIIPEEINQIFPNISYVFGKVPIWSNNDRIIHTFKGTVNFITTHYNTVAFTFISIIPITAEDFHKIIDIEINRFGLTPQKIIRL